MRRDIVYEVKYLIHCIISWGIGIEFCWVPSHCALYWNEISHKLVKLGAMKNILKYTILQSHDSSSILQKTVYKELEKSKPAIPSCLRCLTRVIYITSSIHLNSWNTKYSQNMTCIYKNVLSVNHILPECCITTELFQKNGFGFNACNNVRDSLYSTDVI